MIISRTPFRISFAGGGSDFREFYQEEPGCVVSSTINKYIYLSMHPLFNNNGYHLKYFQNEFVKNVDEIRHPIIKEVFKAYKIKGVDFNSSSDVPSGTGLGSSSSFTVGLINLCSSYKRKEHLQVLYAGMACQIEIDILKAPIGKQDQYASACGGLNFVQFNPDERVRVEGLRLSKAKKKQLEKSLVLFYLGGQRMAGSVLENQKNNININRPILRKMCKLAEDLRDDLNKDCIDNFGQILHEGWMYKKELSFNISNGNIDYWYEQGLKAGAMGGKLLGGGSTGFMLFFAPDADKLRASLKLLELPFNFENTGTQIIYNG